MPTIKKENIDEKKEPVLDKKIKKTPKIATKKKKVAVRTVKKRKTSPKKIVTKKQPTKELSIDNDINNKDEDEVAIKENKDSLILDDLEKEEPTISDIKEDVDSEEEINKEPRFSPPMFLKPKNKNKAKNLVISSIEEGERENDGGKKEEREIDINENIDNNYNNMENTSSTPGRSVGVYRKIAVSFIVLTLILIAVIFYFSFVKVTIILEPNQKKVSNNFIFDVYNENEDKSISNSSTAGVVQAMIVENDARKNQRRKLSIQRMLLGIFFQINNFAS